MTPFVFVTVAVAAVSSPSRLVAFVSMVDSERGTSRYGTRRVRPLPVRLMLPETSLKANWSTPFEDATVLAATWSVTLTVASLPGLIVTEALLKETLAAPENGEALAVSTRFTVVSPWFLIVIAWVCRKSLPSSANPKLRFAVWKPDRSSDPSALTLVPRAMTSVPMAAAASTRPLPARVVR